MGSLNHHLKVKRGAFGSYHTTAVESDAHILNALLCNPKLSTLYVSLFGDPDSDANEATRKVVARMEHHRNDMVKANKGWRPLKVSFYNAASAKVWG